jgi:ketosteroid isomerase-like protein
MTPATASDPTDRNAKLIRDSYAAYARGDVNALVAVLSPDVETTTPSVPGLHSGGTWRGIAGFLEFVGLVNSELAVTRFEPRDIIAQGDKVVGIVDYAATLKATGRSIEVDLVHIFTISKGKVAKLREYYETHLVTDALA